MRLNGVTLKQLRLVIKKVNKEHKTTLQLSQQSFARNMDQNESDGFTHKRGGLSFCLRLDSCRDRFHRRAAITGRRLNCVCWHGHYEFMAVLFGLFPDARLKSHMADYQGAADFRTKYILTGERNAGSIMQPVAYRDLCECNGIVNW